MSALKAKLLALDEIRWGNPQLVVLVSVLVGCYHFNKRFPSCFIAVSKTTRTLVVSLDFRLRHTLDLILGYFTVGIFLPEGFLSTLDT
jgi:hypothetical protein